MTSLALRLAAPALLLALSACGGGSYQAPVNTAPRASAGAAQQVEAGSKVTLEGSGTDAESDLLDYVWTLAKPAGSNATLLNPKFQQQSFIADVAGSYTATLNVSDGKAAAAPVSVTVTATVPVASFVKLWDGDSCAQVRRLYVIDSHLVYARSLSLNSCSEAAADVLYESIPARTLCSTNGFSGALSCDDPANLALMQTIMAGRGKSDLGLGSGHTVSLVYSFGSLP